MQAGDRPRHWIWRREERNTHTWKSEECVKFGLRETCHWIHTKSFSGSSQPDARLIWVQRNREMSWFRKEREGEWRRKEREKKRKPLWRLQTFQTAWDGGCCLCLNKPSQTSCTVSFRRNITWDGSVRERKSSPSRINLRKLQPTKIPFWKSFFLFFFIWGWD